VRPQALTDDDPYPYGAQEHGSTLKAAILAAAEMRIMQAKGAQYQNFAERMQASIAQDSKGRSPEFIGNMNRDVENSGRVITNVVLRYNGEEI
jgi:hypothetical protein